MLRVGLTGGIGSGKTEVALLFKKLGIEVIDADEIAHELTKPNTHCLEKITKHFGKIILEKDGSLNCSTLKKIIFTNLKEKTWLENCLHPVIRQVMKKQITKVKTPYCLLVIPLLGESQNIDFLDRICVVETSEVLQIQRVMKRDHISEDAIRDILKTQCNNKQRFQIADDILYNYTDLDTLKDGVFQLQKKYLKLTRERSHNIM